MVGKLGRSHAVICTTVTNVCRLFGNQNGVFGQAWTLFGHCLDRFGYCSGAFTGQRFESLYDFRILLSLSNLCGDSASNFVTPVVSATMTALQQLEHLWLSAPEGMLARWRSKIARLVARQAVMGPLSSVPSWHERAATDIRPPQAHR